MPKFTVEVRDRAVVDIFATVEVEAEDAIAAIAKIETAEIALDFQLNTDQFGFDREYDPEYQVFAEDGTKVLEKSPT